MGPGVFNNDDEARQAYEQLEMEPLPSAEEGLYVISLRDFVEARSTDAPPDRDHTWFISGDQLDYCMRVPWSAEEAPEIAEWIASNDGPLERAHAASRLPHYRAAIVDTRDGLLSGMLRPNVARTREMSRLLMVRAMQRLDAGDSAGAWDDIHAMHRLARLHSQGYSSIDSLMAIAFFSYASNATSSLLSSTDLTPELLEAIHDDWDRVPDWRNVADVFDTTERYALLDFIQQTARSPSQSFGLFFDRTELRYWYAYPATERVTNAAIDWDRAVRVANQLMEEAVIALNETDLERRSALVAEYDQHLDSIEESAVRLRGLWPSANLGVALFASSMRGIHESILRRDARMALIDTSLAIEQFRFDHGRIPGSLSELVPEYLATVPLDPCSSEETLHYVVHPNDAYVLYSVSHNGVDDGGTSVRDDVIFQVRMPVPEMPQFEPSLSDEISAESEPVTELQ